MSEILREETLQHIDEWCEAMVSLLFNDGDRLLLPKSEGGVKKYNKMCSRFSPMYLYKWIRFIMQRCVVITEIQNLILQNKHVTLRDLFYRQIHLFQCQRGSNESVAFFTHLFEIPRWRLHVISSPRGLVRGKLRFDISSGNRTNTISCYTAAEPYGVPIPAFPEQIGSIFLDETIQYVMVVEKETIFSRIINTPMFHKLGNGILITSKGFPDIATRVFLSKLWKAAIHYKSYFPFFIACDMDPWGIAIAKAYCFAESAEAMWYLPKDVYYPNYTIIHCDYSEAISLWGLPFKEVQDINKRDKTLLNAIQTKIIQDTLLVNRSHNNQFCSTHQQILSLCEYMMQFNKRFELDAIQDLIGFFSCFIGCWI